MGRTVRQKRKARSSRPVVKQSASRRRPVNPTGNAIVAQNWDKTQTLTQNYRRLGLMNRLHQPAGGVEKRGSDVLASRAEAARAKKTAAAAAQKQDKESSRDPFRIDGVGRGTQTVRVREVRVERNAEGQIVRVVEDGGDGGDRPDHPLDDLLNDVEAAEDDSDGEAAFTGFSDLISGAEAGKAATATLSTATAPTPVVAALERLAHTPTAKPPRHLSLGQRTWLQALADRYGTASPDEATLAQMARDRRLNPLQHTTAQLARRLATFRAAGGVAAA